MLKEPECILSNAEFLRLHCNEHPVFVIYNFLPFFLFCFTLVQISVYSFEDIEFLDTAPHHLSVPLLATSNWTAKILSFAEQVGSSLREAADSQGQTRGWDAAQRFRQDRTVAGYCWHRFLAVRGETFDYDSAYLMCSLEFVQSCRIVRTLVCFDSTDLWDDGDDDCDDDVDDMGEYHHKLHSFYYAMLLESLWMN